MAGNNNDMERMQKDAEQRMRDMQRRSQRFTSSHDMPPVPNFVKLNPDLRNEPIKPKPKPQEKPPLCSNTKGGKGFDLLKMLNFKNLKIDSDVIIIVVLIFLLSGDDTDELLLMALLYIML
jgi:hypothetical protein